MQPGAVTVAEAHVFKETRHSRGSKIGKDDPVDGVIVKAEPACFGSPAEREIRQLRIGVALVGANDQMLSQSREQFSKGAALRDLFVHIACHAQ